MNPLIRGKYWLPLNFSLWPYVVVVTEMVNYCVEEVISQVVGVDWNADTVEESQLKKHTLCYVYIENAVTNL